MIGRGALAAASLACAFSLPPQALAADPSPRALRVCADPNNLPFSNVRGEGLENALAELLARDLGARLEYAWLPQRRGFVRNTLDAGLCDVMMSAPASYERVRTTAPLYRSTYVFASRADRKLELRSFEDARLRTLRVGVQLVGDDYANTPPVHALARRGIHGNVIGFPITGDYDDPDPPTRILEAVAAGDVDVAIVWGPLAGGWARASKVRLELAPVEPQIDLPFLPFVFDIAMAVRRDDDALRVELDAWIAQRRGQIDTLLDRFGVPRVAAPADGAAPTRAASPAGATRPVARARGPERVWISNEREGTVSAIDPELARVVATVRVGGRPRGIVVAPDGRTVYVAKSRPRGGDPNEPEGVVAIDAASLRVLRLSAVGSDPECFALATRPPRLYVANEDAGTASIASLADGAIVSTVLVGVEPEGVAISPDERFVYVTAETSNTVSVIDTRSAAVVASFLVETRPRAAAFTSDGALAVVTAEVGRAVSVVDVARHAVIGTARFPHALQRPVGVAIAPDGATAWVATGRADSLALIDLSDPRAPRIAGDVPVGKRPWGVALGADGRRAYTANGASNDVSVVDTTELRVVATIPVGDGPWGVAVGPAPEGTR